MSIWHCSNMLLWLLRRCWLHRSAWKSFKQSIWDRMQHSLVNLRPGTLIWTSYVENNVFSLRLGFGKNIRKILLWRQSKQWQWLLLKIEARLFVLGIAWRPVGLCAHKWQEDVQSEKPTEEYRCPQLRQHKSRITLMWWGWLQISTTARHLHKHLRAEFCNHWEMEAVGIGFSDLVVPSHSSGVRC